MANQFIAICEEATRGTKPGAPTWLYLPVQGKLQPTFTPKDEPRKEFRGADTALGDSSVSRRESQWSYTLETAWYPIAAIGLLLKHAFGKAGTRSALETTAYKGILYPVATPYGAGMSLGTKAIGISVNSDEGGTTKSQYYGGGRIKSVSVAVKGSDDVKLTFEIQGAGEWVGAADQAAIADPDFSTLPAPFNSAEALFYIGDGISRTGSAPDYTDIDAGTMTAFVPDEMTIKLTNGLDDKLVGNGVRGPSKTYRSAQFSAEADSTVDYEDPSSGFSGGDEYKKIFSGPSTNSLLCILNNGELAGDTSENYQAVLDLPLMHQQPETPERNTEGKTPSMKMKHKSLFSSTTEYPAALITVDKVSAY